MTPAEVAFRGARALQAHAERLGLVGSAPVPAPDLARSCLAPMSGWVSRAFDSRQPAPTIAWRARLTGRSVLRSEILVRLP